MKNEALKAHAAAMPHKTDLADLFAEDDLAVELDAVRDWWLENKRDDIAISLTGLLEQCNISFADLARRLAWKPSRISRVLSGRENLTINTIAEIVRAADFDFDLVMRPKSAQRALQPWEGDAMRCNLFEELRVCEKLVAKAQATYDAAERLHRRVFRNTPREDVYSTQLCEANAANDEAHQELFDVVAA